MAMTRTNFDAIAAAICREPNNQTAIKMAVMLIPICKNANPSFDRDRFALRCGEAVWHAYLLQPNLFRDSI